MTCPRGRSAIDDPEGLLRWLGKDRAIVGFADLEELETRSAAFQAVLRQWIALSKGGPT